MSNVENGINIIPTSFVEFVECYPSTAARLANTKDVQEWNEVRDNLKVTHAHLISYIDTSGLIRSKLFVQNLLKKL